MDDEKLIEIMKNQIYKLESDLKVKTETEGHLIYENETLYTENEKLLKKCLEEEDTISKLKNEIIKLKSYVEDFHYLRIENEKLQEENEQIKSDLSEQIKMNKSLKKPVQMQQESPSAKLRQIEYQYNHKISELNEKNQTLLETIENQKIEFEKIIHEMKCDTEILESKIDNYKELIGEIKKEKEELELVYVNLQNDFNKPDFNRQGNNMYFDVDDRRIEAEKALLVSHDQNNILRTQASVLRVYLEKVFAAYSEMKEEEILNYKRDYFNEQRNQENEIQMLKNSNSHMKQIIEDKLKSGMEINTNEQVSILQMQMRILRNEKVYVEKQLASEVDSADRMRKDRNKLYKKSEQLTFENSTLQTKLEKLESKLKWIELKIPKEILQEYEEQEKINEESLQFKQKTNDQYFSPSIFGPYYQEAKYSDKLVFDHFGNPIPNKLTKRVFPDIGKKEVIETAAKPPEEIITAYDFLNSNQNGLAASNCATDKKQTNKTVPTSLLSCQDIKKSSENSDPLSKLIDHKEPINDSEKENLVPASNIQYIEKVNLDEVPECKVS